MIAEARARISTMAVGEAKTTCDTIDRMPLDLPREAQVTIDTADVRVEVHANAIAGQFLADHIDAYNIATTGIPFGGHIVLLIRDAHAAIVAGLSSYAWGDCLHIEYLWVQGDQRGQGYGTMLLAAAERAARSRGCRQAVLETHSFQAPDFYGHRGYTVFGTLDDCPVGYTKYYVKKALR